MKIIDGSYGEGGGQILRTAVALSCITGQDIKVINIREKRPNPGLKRQHLTAIKAAASLCRARVEGLELGSKTIEFRPSSIQSGSFRFDIGTAGSVTLLLQTLVPIMAYAPGPIRLELVGGTDVPWSPPIDYVIHVLIPHLKKVGYGLTIKLLRRGHYPRGRGIVHAEVVSPPKELSPLNLLKRADKIEEIKGISHCVRLPKHVAERQARSAEAKLREAGVNAPIKIDLEYYEPEKDPHLGPGSGIVIWAKAGEAILGGDALGARGKKAEIVGEEAANKLLKDLGTGMALDAHMSDNILIYLALAKGRSVVGGAELSMHAHTVMWVIKQLLNVSFTVSGSVGHPFTAEVVGAGIRA